MRFIVLLSRLLYKKIFKPIFFRQDPEEVHDRITNIGQFLGKSDFFKKLIGPFFSYKNQKLSQKIWGIYFENPVGLSAGFDKNGKLFQIMGSVGFGFATVGTVTYKPYAGNPKPRLYRIPKSRGLIVNYGLKNEGARSVINYFKKRNDQLIPMVVSIGRTNSAETATLENGINDYFNCLKEFVDAGIGDIYEINISCPNTFGGEPFVDPISLKKLLQKIYTLPIKKPIFLKMPLNLAWLDFKNLIDLALAFRIEALVISNLNKDRSENFVKDKVPAHIKGNVSGKPNQNISDELIAKTYDYCKGQIKIIGVGGIFSAEDAYRKIRLGANLVALITGMIYEGPQLISEINRGLSSLIEKDGYKNIEEAVGTLKI